MYAPNSHFSRKAPGEPIFIVSVWPRGHPPLLAQAAAVDMAAGSVPVRYSSVEFGDIAFYAMPRTELKTIFR